MTNHKFVWRDQGRSGAAWRDGPAHAYRVPALPAGSFTVSLLSKRTRPSVWSAEYSSASYRISDSCLTLL